MSAQLPDDMSGLASDSAIFDRAQWQAIALALNLSEREYQIIQGVFDHQSESEIAKSLEISSHTVHSHFVRLYRKLGVNSRTELILRVFATFISSV